MNWKNGFSASYYAYIIDPKSWRETTRLDITGGSISRSLDGLRDTADIECTFYDPGPERYIRIYLDAMQNGAACHEPLFTGLATSPARNIEGLYETNTVECYSVLKAAEDILLQRGYYVPAGCNSVTVIKELLSCTPAPIIVSGTAPSLQRSIIAEDGETRRSMADKVLAAINWRIRIAGDGTIEICEKPTTVSAHFDPIEQDVIEPSITVNYDLFNCPNVFRAIQDDLSAVARDDSPDSPLSTVNRGREVWKEDTSCELSSGESISEYAARRLKELQRVQMKAEYDRRFNPDVLVGDLINLHYPAQFLEGVFRVTSQTIELSHNAKTSEVVEAL